MQLINDSLYSLLYYFYGICQRQCHYEFITVFWKSWIVFCAKPKEVDPIKLISLWQISVSIALKYIINNKIRKETETRHRWLQHFLLSLKISVTTIYRSIGAMIHQPLAIWWSSSHNQFVTLILSPLPCSSVLVHHTLLFVYFFKQLISFFCFLDKCYTSIFNALIK